VPPSLTTNPSASATVIDEPTEVPPSKRFSSAAVDDIAVLPKVNPPSGTTMLLPDCAVNVLAVN
jgi:hypothetical protein